MEISVLLIIFFSSIVLLCFFAGIEIAFASANKLSIELSKKQGTYSGKTWGNFAEHPTRFIGTILVAINFMLVIYGLLVGEMLSPVWNLFEKEFNLAGNSYVQFIRLLVETLLASGIILFLMVISRAFFHTNSSRLINNGVVSYFSRFFYWLFAGLATGMIGASEWILQYIFNVKLSDKKEVFSKIDLEHFLQQTKGTNEDESSELNKELFENALSISDTKLRECLVPRKEIVSIRRNSTIEEVKQKMIETSLSKLVVLDSDIDNIAGYIHQLDLFKHPNSIDDILLPIPTVPESMTVAGMMDKFGKERKIGRASCRERV